MRLSLKMYTLTATALFLWLTPLYTLDKKVNWHRAIQGMSLIASFSCAVVASVIAKKLADDEAYLNAKRAVTIADLQDELAQGAYLSEQERRIQTQRYLTSLQTNEPPNELPEPANELPELQARRESLERLFTAGSSESLEPRTAPNLTNEQRERIELIRKVWAKGIVSKNRILKEVWGVSPGDNQPYKNARAEYEFLIQFMEG